MTYILTTDIEVHFVILDDEINRYIDQETGDVDVSLLADSMSVELNGRSAYFLRVAGGKAV